MYTFLLLSFSAILKFYSNKKYETRKRKKAMLFAVVAAC
jgi:hypothetical protein